MQEKSQQITNMSFPILFKFEQSFWTNKHIQQLFTHFFVFVFIFIEHIFNISIDLCKLLNYLKHIKKKTKKTITILENLSSFFLLFFFKNHSIASNICNCILFVVNLSHSQILCYAMIRFELFNRKSFIVQIVLDNQAVIRLAMEQQTM